MIAREDHDRVVAEPEAVECVEHDARLRIDERDTRAVGLHRLAAQVTDEPPLLRLAAGKHRRRHVLIVVGGHFRQLHAGQRVLREPGLRRHVGRVRPVETDCQKKRRLRFGKPLEQFHRAGRGDAVGLFSIGAIGCQPTHRGSVLARLERNNLRLVGHVAALGIEDGIPAGRIVEAGGADLARHAVVVELADPLASPARLLEGLRQRDDGGINVAKVFLVAADGRVGGPAAGEQARAAGITERILTVGPLEPHAPRREPIDVGRLGRRITVARERTAEVIADDKQHIRASRRRRVCGLSRPSQEEC